MPRRTLFLSLIFVDHCASAAGLAAFSITLDKDPWQPERDFKGAFGQSEGQLCAHLVGGTMAYMSPEQLRMMNVKRKEVECKDVDRAAESELMLTPATSDLYQAAMTMVEAHARYDVTPFVSVDKPSAPQEAADRCAARTPDSDVKAFSPEEALAWLAEKCKKSLLAEGTLVANDVGGAKLLDLAYAKDWKVLKNELGVKIMARARILQMQMSP